MKLRLLLFCAILLTVQLSHAQPSQNVLDYINTYKDLAISEEIRTGVPAAIKLAQGIHETEAGMSVLVRKSNNHFGIKCKTGWSGDKVYHDDDARGECFRSYGAAEDSYRDHSDFLKRSQRYAFLFELDPTDYKGWAYGLKQAGYATNIKYSQILVRLIETYDLQQYTLIALGRPRPDEPILVTTEPVAPTGNTSSTTVGAMPVKVPVQYPSGEFTINRTKVVFVSAGVPLLSIATKYDIPLARLLDFNDIREDGVLERDQLIFLQRKRKTGENAMHVVVPGEDLYDICQSEGIRLESLLEFNQLQLGMLPAPGEKLFLQTKAPQRPALVSQLQPATQNTLMPASKVPEASTPLVAARHTVQQKETLYSISRKYGVHFEQIREWNKLDSLSLKPGQELVIYKN